MGNRGHCQGHSAKLTLCKSSKAQMGKQGALVMVRAAFCHRELGWVAEAAIID